MIYSVPKPKKRSKGSRTPLRKTRLKAVNRKRGGHMFPKNVNEDFRQWIRFKPCVLGMRMRYAGRAETFENCDHILQHVCNSAVRGCHVKSRGSGGKDVGNMYPGCDSAHDEQHRIGIPAFEKRWDIHLKNIAEAFGLRYLVSDSGGAHQ